MSYWTELGLLANDSLLTIKALQMSARRSMERLAGLPPSRIECRAAGGEEAEEEEGEAAGGAEVRRPANRSMSDRAVSLHCRCKG